MQFRGRAEGKYFRSIGGWTDWSWSQCSEDRWCQSIRVEAKRVAICIYRWERASATKRCRIWL